MKVILYIYNVNFVFAGKPCPLPPYKYKELWLRENFRNMAALYACPYGTVQGYQTMQCGDDGKWIENLKPCEGINAIRFYLVSIVTGTNFSC